MRLQILSAPFFALAIFSAIVAKSKGNGNPTDDLQGTKQSREESQPIVPNDSKNLRIESEHEIIDQGSPPSGTMNRENNQALNSFLKNVLRAQDELKWIDSRVDGAKDPQERSPRYQRTSRRDPDPKARSKRRSGYELDENESRPSANKRKVYYEYEEAGNRAQGVYPEDETETKREAKEGPRVSEGWFEYNDDDAESLRDSRQATDLKVHNESSSTNDLESLRRTVLALSRSLEESDKKVDEMAENELRGVVEESKDRERHVGEIFERKKSRGKGAKEIEDPGDFGQAFGASSSGSSWWDDPRTAVDMFDFKRRDDDEGMDDEDEDEDSEPGMSEFDYNAMRRVKRERDNDLGEPGVIRVYNRAGFGASYREGGGGYERRKRRSGYEKDAEELEGSGNVSREISGESMAAVMRDKVINEGGDGAEMRKIVNANDRSGGQAEVVNKSEAKNSGDDNPAGGNPGEVKEIVAEDPDKQETRRNEILDDELASKNEVIKTPESETTNEKREEAKQEAQKSQSNAYEVVKSSTDSNEVKKDEEQTKRREEETGVNGDSKTPGKVKMTDATRVEKNKESIDVKMAGDNQPDSRTEKNNDESEDRKPKIQEDSKSVKLGEVKEENADNNGLHSKSDELTRKLLWLSENEESYLKNDREKFAKRSLMATKERKMRRCKVFAKTPRRSVRSYPESVEADKSMEEASREDKEDVHRSETRKRSVRRIIERRRDPDLAADVYEVEVEDDGVADQDDENDNLKESRASNDEDGEAELALVSFAGSDVDRDPIRDRINMLIKQKLDDREKGKLVHVKREVNDPTRIIEYYDYDSDENVIDSEADLSLAESDQAQNSTVTGEVHGNDTAESTGGGNTIPKKDENAEEEKKQEENQNNTKIEPPKEEFISNIDASKAETTKPPSGVDVTTVPQPAFEEGQRPYGEDRNLQDEESRNESNEHHEDRAAKSSDSRWLGESQDQDSRNEKSTDDQPFEYSVNVHGKIDPDSIGNVKDKLTGSDEDWKYEGPQDGKEVENEELDKERAARRDWRYRDSTR
ncbi:uncharacterized protein LOC124177390 [Neodiprion fabricii]|uniref:uncharacterized protein LOC124177390 n=1 Tax=Neodiprion fabricii TaxID=2872261 RepID=UPI001ED90444|nr:uncharacterized protein LOC124177390 [Neodiprion fabricii]